MSNEAIKDNLLDVFSLVVIGHFNVSTARLEVNSDLLTKDFILDTEVLEDNVLDRVVKSPAQSAVEISIDTLHIGKADLLAKNHLVEGTNEESIQEASVENGKTYDTSNELEVAKMLRVDA